MYMYAKSGIMQDPWRVFNKMPSQGVVTLTAMILGHVQYGQASTNGTGTISANATGRCAARFCYLCGVSECMFHCCGI